MRVDKKDPRWKLSRRSQDFHASEPQTQAALRGEKYFAITPGHLASVALESGLFKTVDQFLKYFDFDRSILSRSEPFTDNEIDAMEGSVISSVENNYLPDHLRRYEQWASAVIDALTVDERDRQNVIERLTDLAKEREPSPESVEYADELDSRLYETDFHEGWLRMQIYRGIRHFSEDGFVITVDAAIKSLIANGLADPEDLKADYAERSPRWAMAEVVSHGMHRDLTDKVISLEDGKLQYNEVHERDIDGWTLGYDSQHGDPLLMSSQDLMMYARHYCPDIPGDFLTADPQYRAIADLFMNTPERIAEVQGHVNYLTDRTQGSGVIGL
jgi:hypothetical protein